MKKVVFIILILCEFSSAFAQNQNDFVDRFSKQVIEIDSLKKIVKAEKDSTQQQRKLNHTLQDTLRRLRSDLASLEEFKKEKKNIDSLLRQKADSITSLQKEISEKDNQITAENQKSEKKAREENEKGKNEILTTIVNSYKNKSFEELLKSPTKQSAQRDAELIKNSTELKQILADVEKYFSAKELLDVKLDAVQIKSHQIQLEQIKRESALLSKLKETIGNYQVFNEGLKETLGKIVVLDKAEAVSGMSKEIQRKKFDKILAEISAYIFNYDFNFSNYPYLSDIFLEIIKRKQPNPDADISDLLKRL
ncbi:MAG: hypothetical protein IPH89_00195 [Bacteroidetes bacterium]|nr:hypothetical protein [Bacteroidota bacterium]HQV85236.1 hypothetical protein [Chitinophagaceae bacterium]